MLLNPSGCCCNPGPCLVPSSPCRLPVLPLTARWTNTITGDGDTLIGWDVWHWYVLGQIASGLMISVNVVGGQFVVTIWQGTSNTVSGNICTLPAIKISQNSNGP